MASYIVLAKGLLRNHEGYRDRPYRCPAGKWTWGYGRNIEDNPLDVDEQLFLLRNLGDPRSIAEFLLERDVERSASRLTVFSWWRALNDARKAAMIDFVFNLGMARFLGFKKANAALTAGDYSRAADEMLDSKWAGQVGARATTIARIIRDGVIS